MNAEHASLPVFFILRLVLKIVFQILANRQKEHFGGGQRWAFFKKKREVRRVPHTSYIVACQISKKDLKRALRILNFSVILKLPFTEI